MIKTVTTTAGINTVEFPEFFKIFWIKNKGGTTVYVSAKSDITAGADDVAEVAPDDIVSVENYGDRNVYIMGAGEFEIHALNVGICPFKLAQKGGDISAEGDSVQLDGLQGGVPFSEVTVKGKNLINYPYFYSSRTINGVTFTDNGDGTITVDGTSTAQIWYFLRDKSENTMMNMADGIYTLSGCPDGGSDSTYKLSMTGFNGTDGISWDYDFGNGVTVECNTNQHDKFNCYIYINSGVTVDSLVFRPMLELGDTATEYAPTITGQELTITVNDTDYTITPDSNPYTVPTEIYQQDGINTIYVTGEGEPTLSVKGVKTNAAVKRIWDKLNELTTAIIVSNGEI